MDRHSVKEYRLPYGSGFITVNVPERNLCEYLPPNRVKPAPSEELEIKKALDNPIGSKKVEEMVRPSDKVAILCEDISRFARTDKMLEILVERLNNAGVPDKNIKIIMALGSHRPMTPEEKISKVGKELFKRLKVLNSEFRDRRKLVDMGTAPGGVRVWLDRSVYESDVRIGVGSIVPHTAAGYTGGGKIIYPGVVGEETVAQFHLLSASFGNLIGQVDNPARLAMEEWVKVVGLDYIVNAVVTPDNKTYKVVAGHYVEAHREGVRYAREVYEVRAHSKVEIAIVSSHTADLDFWQAGKGITNCEKLLHDGGLLILLSPCPEGVGPHPSFMDYIASEDPEGLIAKARKGEVDPKQILPLAVGAAVAKIRKRVKIAVVSDGIGWREIKRARLLPFENVQMAIEYGLSQYGEKARISLVPVGGDSYIHVEEG